MNIPKAHPSVMIFPRSVSAGLKNDICRTESSRPRKPTADERRFTQMGDGNGIAAKEHTAA
jgi:hypothetical protein